MRCKLGGWLDAEVRGLSNRARVSDLFSENMLLANLAVKGAVVDVVRLKVRDLWG